MKNMHYQADSRSLLKLPKLTKRLITTTAGLVLAVQVNASIIITYGTTETFDANGFVTTDSLTSTSNWSNTTPSGSNANSVVINDQGTTGVSVGSLNVARIRRATGQITFIPALSLATDGAISLTVELDYQGREQGNILDFEYSALGDFTDAVIFGTIDNSAPNTTAFTDATYTATDGVGGVVFSDTASIRIIVAGGSAAGADGTSVDNISVTAEAVAVIPEPSSAALLGIGGLALILRRRR